MDWIIVIGLGALLGGFHGIGVAIVAYAAFWAVLLILAELVK